MSRSMHKHIQLTDTHRTYTHSACIHSRGLGGGDNGRSGLWWGIGYDRVCSTGMSYMWPRSCRLLSWILTFLSGRCVLTVVLSGFYSACNAAARGVVKGHTSSTRTGSPSYSVDQCQQSLHPCWGPCTSPVRVMYHRCRASIGLRLPPRRCKASSSQMSTKSSLPAALAKMLRSSRSRSVHFTSSARRTVQTPEPGWDASYATSSHPQRALRHC